MDSSDRIELAMVEFLTESGLRDVYAWGDEREDDMAPVEYMVMVTRVAVEPYPDRDLGLYAVRIATRGGSRDDNRVEDLIGHEDGVEAKLSPYFSRYGMEARDADLNQPQEKTEERNRRERVFNFNIFARVNPQPAALPGRRLEVDGSEVHADDSTIEFT